MPKTPIDYSKTIIYKICCKDIKIVDCYVGSTNDFNRRKGEHKSHCYNENHKNHNYPVYEFIRSHGDWANWSMIPVELYKTCTNKLEKLARERYYVELLNATLNSFIPGRTQKEYYKDNIEYHKQHNAKYHASHKEHINTKNECLICGGKYTNAHKTLHFRTQKHQNYIKRQQLLANHNAMMNNIDQINEITTKFIKKSDNFIKRLNI